MSDGPCINTDREIYRGPSPAEWGDDDRFYADSIHVTENGGIGINCGGHVIVMPLRKWFEAAQKEAYAVALRAAAKNFYAMVEGESPSLLEDDHNAFRLWELLQSENEICHACDGSGLDECLRDGRTPCPVCQRVSPAICKPGCAEPAPEGSHAVGINLDDI